MDSEKLHPISHIQMRSVWPPPSGITVLPEIIPTPEDVEKHTNILLNSLPQSTRKVIEKLLKHSRNNEEPNEDAL